MATYEGLSADDFADIHAAVAEAMALVTLPVTFYVASVPDSNVNRMYGEAVDGNENFVVYGGAPLRASVKMRPADEQLTRLGLVTGAHILGFIPRQHIIDWEADSGLTWAPNEAMEVEYQGVRYNITQLRSDDLPVGDGSASDTIGPVFTGMTKPMRLKA